MQFNSLIFCAFLPVVFALYWLCRPAWRNTVLLAASYFFYYYYSPFFLLLLAATSAFDFWCARQMALNPPRKKAYLVLSLLSNLGILAAFKYSALVYNAVSGSFELITHSAFNPIDSLVVPAGLSFYTFQSISNTLDVYRGKCGAERNLPDFLLFVSFFPHMVAGPIVRYNALMPQLKALSFLRQVDAGLAARLITWGYFKKLVIADNIDLVVSPVFSDVGAYNGISLLACGFLFVVQVYCDFSGYSDIATGVARLFNIDLGINWLRPLLSRSLHEFWRRNHISLTTWFRDYLYIGLGGSRKGYARWLLNIFIVFVVSGLWHGANVTFIVWGAMHGAMYIAEILVRRAWPQLKLPSLAGWLYLISFHTVTLLAFRANNLEDLATIYGRLTGLHAAGRLSLFELQDTFYFAMVAALILFLFLKELAEEHLSPTSGSVRRWRPVLYVGLATLIFVLGNFSSNAFIYFQF